ncbi:FxSxx-COOH cyclophane-containing RiPP peptide [Nonomuraea sp. LP-02]|uniref:FxSxx-COOH cyclophane-containing RiPP peptide n=1 Tax=Nonomuraea sp. LP-02 TaxID=3097960 RepID=UPI002E31D3A0|nr:FxSxx-COOH cyclophane-containing RiPP peptide [Nonomuraea sp. LP-02]MED7926548.1 FxSxx-COOH cyclophane-containing RiPP peptide [Nonomuraea sp. LP-02]
MRATETDGVRMRDGHQKQGTLIDVSALSLADMLSVESAALRAAMTSCLDEGGDVAAFTNSLAGLSAGRHER